MPDPSLADPPFACPPDWSFDIPVPPSVNRTRRVDLRNFKKYKDWKEDAGWQLVSSGQYRAGPRNLQRYELTVTLNEKLCRQDPDNPIKAAIDLLRSLNIITDDGPKFARRIVIEWGEAPLGCRLTLKGLANGMDR